MAKTYLFRPRGKGFAFQVAVPKDLRDKFKSKRTGRPRHKIVIGLDTDSEVKAKRKAAALSVEWSRRFERARLDVPLTLGEIEDYARETYAALLAVMEANTKECRPSNVLIAGGQTLETGLSQEPLPRAAFETHSTSRQGHSPDAFLSGAVELMLNETAQSGGLESFLAKVGDFDQYSLAPDIARIEARTGVSLDRTSETHRTLCQAILRARIAAAKGRLRALQGEPTERPPSFLGANGIDPITLQPKSLKRPFVARDTVAHGPWSLFEEWITAAKPAPSTVNRWRAVFLNLQARFRSDLITEHNARSWTNGLVGEGRSAVTAHDVWLIGARTVYGWAAENRLIDDNPFAKVKITVPKTPVTRDRAFTPAEAASVLNAANAIEIKSTFAAAQRWCPWLAAYSGARIGELTQLRAEDVKQIEGIWCITLTPDAGTTKTKRFRNVPLHAHLIKLGFLEFVAGKDGPLFYTPGGESKEQEATNPPRPRAVKCRERLAAWSRQLVPDKGIAPNHAWRHTWKTVAARAGISDSLSDTITGHASLTVAGRYLHPTASDMAAALRKFPRYRLD